MKFLKLLLFTITVTFCVHAQDDLSLSNLQIPQLQAQNVKEQDSHTKVYWTIKEVEHPKKEFWKHVGILYGVIWIAYPLTQIDAFLKEGSFKKYKSHLGKFVFDNDEPIWNWGFHPFVGSQVFLYARTHGYDRMDSLFMAFVNSTLFELTIETYTESASIQDLYQTPIYGACLGLLLEKSSLYLLNSESTFSRVLGHILNPSTLLKSYTGKIVITPYINAHDKSGVLINADF